MAAATTVNGTGSGGGSSVRTPKAGGGKKTILPSKAGSGAAVPAANDGQHSVISGVTENTTTTLTARQMGTIHRSPRAKSSSMFQKPTQLQAATVWDVISPPVRTTVA